MTDILLKAPTAALLAFLSWIPAASGVDVKRAEVRAFIDETSREFGFPRAQLAGLLAQAETKQPILDAISRPAERVVPWFEYRERFLTEKRILQGTDFWMAHGEALRRIPDPNVAASVVGILGVETSFGRITGRYRVIDALTTLAFDYPPRSAFFRGELQQFLLLSREESVDPKTALGSYAGAMGAPQFISSSYRNYAIDGDGNGKRDLWNSWDDVIGSVANYLLVYGWREGEPVVVTATLPGDDLSRFDTSKVELNETVASLRNKGVTSRPRCPRPLRRC
jgi:membrane-bound lytic murein transglycosylase B